MRPPPEASEPSRRAGRLLGALCRTLLQVFYRQIEVSGRERIPRGAPLAVVANHANGLVDPLFLLGPLDLPVHFLAKSTLWKIPILGPLLDWAGAIPIYRPQDLKAAPGAAEAITAETLAQQNEEAFVRCHQVLAAGGAIALFPEGTSHSHPALRPLKTGAARIVLEAEHRLGPLGTRILPIGLYFEAKGRFRSRALVRIGEAFDPTTEVSLDPRERSEAVRALTARIDEALKTVTLNFPTWDEARRIARAADLFARPSLEVPTRRSLEETFALQSAFLDGYREMRESHPERTAALAAALESYDQLLEAAGVTDEQVASRYSPSPVLRFLGRTVLRLLVHLPLAAVGTLLNIVPYRLVGWIAARWAGTVPDQQATLKVFPGLVLYPLTWLAEALAVGHWAGAGWGLATFLAAPLAGYAAVLFHERRKYFWREARAFLVLRTRRRLASELRERREAVGRGVGEMVEEYRKGRASEPGRPGQLYEVL